jgi:hypothetical protein
MDVVVLEENLEIGTRVGRQVVISLHDRREVGPERGHVHTDFLRQLGEAYVSSLSDGQR